jgi:hypothetical protein
VFGVPGRKDQGERVALALFLQKAYFILLVFELYRIAMTEFSPFFSACTIEIG